MKIRNLGYMALLWVSSLSVSYADIITEIGAGIKLPDTTSIPLLPECHYVFAYDRQGNLVSDRSTASCGGDNPAFIGWPIAWEREFNLKRRSTRVRCGWFHMSHWTDGGRERETHMDLAACSGTIVWRGR